MSDKWYVILDEPNHCYECFYLDFPHNNKCECLLDKREVLKDIVFQYGRPDWCPRKTIPIKAYTNLEYMIKDLKGE